MADLIDANPNFACKAFYKIVKRLKNQPKRRGRSGGFKRIQTNRIYQKSLATTIYY